MMRRWQIRTIFALIILCLILSLFYVNSNKTLKIGVITGSNWDVPSPDALKIVEAYSDVAIHIGDHCYMTIRSRHTEIIAEILRIVESYRNV